MLLQLAAHEGLWYHDAPQEDMLREIRFSSRAKEITLWVTAALVLFLLYRTAHLLPPFLWAIVFTYIFHPLVTFMTRQTGVPRAIWILLIYIGVFSAVAWTVMNVGPIVQAQTVALAEEAPNALDQIQAYVHKEPFLRQLGVENELNQLRRQLNDVVSTVTEWARRIALPVISHVVDSAVKFFIFLVTTFYLLLHAERIKGFFLGLAPRPYQHELDSLIERINDALGAYLRSQLLLIAFMSAATFLFLTIIHVQYALVLGLVTGVLEIIPLVGPYSAGAIAVGVALFQSTTPFGWSHLTLAIVVAIGYFVLRQTEDNLVIPVVVGRVVHLNPILVIFALMAGGTMFGLLGLLIAVPMASVIRILAQYFYSKIVGREPPHIVSIGIADDPVELVSQAQQAGARRLVLVCPDGNSALRDVATFQQLEQMILTEDLDVTLISSDSIALGLARTHGISLAAA